MVIIPSLFLGVVGMALIALLTYLFSSYFFNSSTFDNMIEEHIEQRDTLTNNVKDKRIMKKERQKKEKVKKKERKGFLSSKDSICEADEICHVGEDIDEKKGKKKADVNVTFLDQKPTHFDCVSNNEAEKVDDPNTIYLDSNREKDCETKVRRVKRKHKAANVSFPKESLDEKHNLEVGEKEASSASSQALEEPIVARKAWLTGEKDFVNSLNSNALKITSPTTITTKASRRNEVLEEVLTMARNGQLNSKQHTLLLKSLDATPLVEVEILRESVHERNVRIAQVCRELEQIQAKLIAETSRNKTLQHTCVQLQQRQIQMQSQSKSEITAAQQVALESAQKDQERLCQFESQFVLLNENLKKRTLQFERVEHEKRCAEERLLKAENQLLLLKNQYEDKVQLNMAEEACIQRRVWEEQQQSLRHQLLKRDEEYNEVHRQLELTRRSAQELKNENERLRLASTCATSHADCVTELAKVRNELVAYKDKNNELRIKNWKVIEEFNRTREELRKLHAAREDSPKQQQEHLALQNEVKLLEIKLVESQTKFQQEAEECKCAWSEAARFQNCLNETDAMLQRLQHSVDEEQMIWAETLKEAEMESKMARAEIQRLLSVEMRLYAAQEAHQKSQVRVRDLEARLSDAIAINASL